MTRPDRTCQAPIAFTPLSPKQAIPLHLPPSPLSTYHLPHPRVPFHPPRPLHLSPNSRPPIPRLTLQHRLPARPINLHRSAHRSATAYLPDPQCEFFLSLRRGVPKVRFFPLSARLQDSCRRWVGYAYVRTYVRMHARTQVGRYADFVASSHAAARRSGCACMRLPAIACDCRWLDAGRGKRREARGKRQEARSMRQEVPASPPLSSLHGLFGTRVVGLTCFFACSSLRLLQRGSRLASSRFD
jgi:hypothetical protein